MLSAIGLTQEQRELYGKFKKAIEEAGAREEIISALSGIRDWLAMEDRKVGTSEEERQAVITVTTDLVKLANEKIASFEKETTTKPSSSIVLLLILGLGLYFFLKGD